MVVRYWQDLAGPAWVYRLYDGADQLLYVGVTWEPPRRLANHRGKPWWSRVARLHIKWYPSRAEAFAAEKASIITEHPTFNVARPKEAVY